MYEMKRMETEWRPCYVS